jgi:hypothetical protein
LEAAVDPTLLASGAIAVLVTFLKSVANKSAERAGDAAAAATVGGLRGLYQAIKTKLSKDDTDAGTLAKLEAEPANVARQRALEGVLIEAIQKDPAFAEEVARRLTGTTEGGLHVADSGAVAGGDLRLAGQYVAGRDLTLGQLPQHR